MPPEQGDRQGRHTLPEVAPAAVPEELDRQVVLPDRRGRAPGAPTSDLQEAVSRFETAFASAPIGMALVSIQGRWLEVNDAFCQIVGHPDDELRRTTLQALAHPEDVDRDERAFQDLLAGRVPSYQADKRYRDASGRYVWLGLTVSMVRDRRGEPLYVVTQIQDISERKDAASRLEYLVDHDLLTGLYNRQHFQREVAREAERMTRHGAQGAVLMIDLDNFKNVNDTFGHKAGDDFLRGIAGVLRQRGRHTDVLARVGGDEFAMLLSDTDADQACMVAESIVKVLGRQVAVLGEQTIRMTASVGVAVFDGLRVVDVLEFADLAMYEAKEAGRNRFAVNESGGAHPGLVSRRTEVELIRTALKEDRLLLYCQPILDLKTGEVCQYEALVRLQTGVGSSRSRPAHSCTSPSAST
jgi:diguanylate cyclase (GGDEF)-like protein/PAS domain S-box-containing protein